jgi:hypothetical protein
VHVGAIYGCVPDDVPSADPAPCPSLCGQTEEYRNVVKTHKQTKEGLKARLNGPGLTGPDAANHSEELR